MRTRTLASLDLRPMLLLGSLLLVAALCLRPVLAQEPEFEAAVVDPPAYDDATLEDLVGPIALYPDDVLAIILPASTFPLDIVRAARFLDALEDDPSLEPDDAWDDSVVALLNYPEVLRMMNEDLDWTWALGEAVLADEAAVLDAAQRFRTLAYDAGNLRSDDKQIVSYSDHALKIKSADPKVVYVPVYEPSEVIVYHVDPYSYHYYPFGYPVYYYPYPAGYSFGADFFWGVTSYFSLGWSSHFLHVYHYTSRFHPYYLNSYYLYRPYYPRNHVNVTVNIGNEVDVWRPSTRRGARPRAITTESRTSSVRTRRDITTESQPGLTDRPRAPTSQTTNQSAARESTSNFGGVATRSTRRSNGTTRSGAITDTTRPVESRAVTESQTRSVRTRDVSPQTTTPQPGITPSTRRPQVVAPQSAPPVRSRSTITSQGSTTRRSAPVTRAPPAAAPSPPAAPRSQSSSSSSNFGGVRQQGRREGAGTTRTRQR